MVLSAVRGKSDGEDDNCSNFVVDGGPDVYEDKLIDEKTLLRKHLFSSTGPSSVRNCPPIDF